MRGFGCRAEMRSILRGRAEALAAAGTSTLQDAVLM